MHVADAFRRQAGEAVIVAPPVAVFSQWAEDLALRIALLEGRTVAATASPQRLGVIWEEQAPADLAVLAAAERSLAARRAREADRLLTNWWPAAEPAGLDPQFRGWRKRVHARLESDALATPEAWLLALAGRLEQDDPLPLDLPETISWDGFFEFTALERRLLEALAGRGTRPEQPTEMTQEAADLRLFGYPTLGDELTAAARWAQAELARGRQRIAVVVNGLEGEARELRKRFENVFCAHSRVGLQDPVDAPFHISRGEPLSEHPVIADALLLLSLCSDGLDRPQEFPRLSRWLLSPYWRGAAAERSSRASLEMRLRRDGRFKRSLLDVLRFALASGRGAPAAGELACLNETLQRLQAQPPAAQAEPARFFMDCLVAWGWPGTLGDGRDALRHVSAFNGLLERLAEPRPGGLRRALADLRRLCAESRLVLRGGPLSPIQVLSPQDAAGMPFESAWVANLHEVNWPGQPLNNPYLPGRLLRDIPRATPTGELAWCEQITGALKALAPELRFSWSRQAGNVPNGVSPVLEELPRVDAEQQARAAEPGAGQWADYGANPWLRAVEDGQGWPLAAATGDRPEPIPGGSGMLRDQSACPLMAYFSHRLRARFEPMPGPFAEPAYRGELMHVALHELYRGPLQQGSVLPQEMAAEAIEAAVEGALRARHAAARLLPVSLDAERQRLAALLHEWLAFESARRPFTVQGLETRIESNLLGHPLSLRADRLDRLEDGRLMIIDYKSSAVKITGWSKLRLAEPQLPLYAVLLSRESGEQVGALALATARGGECTLAGVAAEALFAFDGIRAFDSRQPAHARQFADWDALFAHWAGSVDALAAEIIAGRADNVVYDDAPLQWAGLEILLRREEGEAWLLAHEEPAPGVAGGKP